jgi:hypothetical protein
MREHKYEVYLMDGRTIVVHADNMIHADNATSDTGTSIVFSVHDRVDGGTIIAEFFTANISGWAVIE